MGSRLSRLCAICAALVAVIMAACAGQPLSPAGADNRLRVVATTGLIADVVRQVAGERIDLSSIMGSGQDPHTYEPVPADIAKMQTADVVFANGLGYEEGLVAILKGLEGSTRVVYVSDGVAVLPGGGEHTAGDPHTWMDPTNVMIWVDNIISVLAELDPAYAATYHANADAYKTRLEELDAAIKEQVASIPETDRKLVTDHESLGYFARRYGFQIVGAVIPNVSTSAEPSAADLASLVKTIREQHVKAIFVSASVNDELARQVAAEIGYPVQILRLYHDLGGPGSGAESYIDMMRVNIETIVTGLKGSDS